MAQIAKTSEQIGDRGPAVHSSVGSSTAGIQALPETGPTNRVYRWDKLKNALGKFLIQRKLQNYNPSPDVLAQAFEGLLLEEQSALNLVYLVHAPYLIPGKTINQEDEKILRNFHDGALELMADYVHNLAFHLPMNRGINRKISTPLRQESQQKKLPSPPADVLPPSLSPPAPAKEDQVKDLGTETAPPIQPLVRETIRSSTSNEQYYEWGRLKDEVGKALSAHCKLTGLTPTYDHLCGAFQLLSENEQLIVNAIYKVRRPHPIAGEDFPAKREVAFRKSCQAITVKMAEHIRDIAYCRFTQPAGTPIGPPTAKAVDQKTPGKNTPAPEKDPLPPKRILEKKSSSQAPDSATREWVEQIATAPDNELCQLLEFVSLDEINDSLTMRRKGIKILSISQLELFFKRDKPGDPRRFTSSEKRAFLVRFGKTRIRTKIASELMDIREYCLRERFASALKKVAKHLKDLGKEATRIRLEGPAKEWVNSVKVLDLEDLAVVLSLVNSLSLEKIKSTFGEPAEKLNNLEQLLPFFRESFLSKAVRQAQVFLLDYGRIDITPQTIMRELEVNKGTIGNHRAAAARKFRNFLESLTLPAPPPGEGIPDDLVPASTSDPTASVGLSPLATEEEFIRIANQLDAKISWLIWLLCLNGPSQEKPKEDKLPEEKEAGSLTHLEVFHRFGLPNLKGKTYAMRFLKCEAFRQKLNRIVDPETLARVFKDLKSENQEIMKSVFLKGEPKTSVGLRHNIVTNAGVRSRIKRIFEIMNAKIASFDVQTEQP
jgi:hypothetical protein